MNTDEDEWFVSQYKLSTLLSINFQRPLDHLLSSMVHTVTLILVLLFLSFNEW